MVTYSNHGGSCCGMRHIWQFRDENTEAYINGLIEKIRRCGADDRLQLEVILSDRQTRENAALVDELARLGFVYTSSWTGQHGTPVHLFLRAKRRLALSSANFYERWTQAGGMLPHPALSGDLPMWRDTVQQAAPARDARYVRRRDYNNLLVGDRVQVNSPNSRYYGQRATVAQLVRRAGVELALRSVAILDLRNDQGRRIELACSSLEIVERVAEPEAPVPPEPVRETYRHPNAEGLAFPAERPVAEPAARRLILSQFYCVFRENGQPSRVFATLNEGQLCYPRARDWHERRVYSDGEIVEGPVNHG